MTSWVEKRRSSSGKSQKIDRNLPRNFVQILSFHSLLSFSPVIHGTFIHQSGEKISDSLHLKGPQNFGYLIGGERRFSFTWRDMKVNDFSNSFHCLRHVLIIFQF